MHPTLNFYFELTVENFIELTKETTIKGGVIEDGLIFYFQNGKNGLVRYDGESAKRMIYADRIIQAIDTSEVPLYSEVILDKRNSVGTKLFYLGYGAVKVSGKMYYNDEIIKRIKEGSLERNVWSQLNYQYEHVQTVINAVDGVDTYYNRPVKHHVRLLKILNLLMLLLKKNVIFSWKLLIMVHIVNLSMLSRKNLKLRVY